MGTRGDWGRGETGNEGRLGIKPLITVHGIEGMGEPPKAAKEQCFI